MTQLMEVDDCFFSNLSMWFPKFVFPFPIKIIYFSMF